MSTTSPSDTLGVMHDIEQSAGSSEAGSRVRIVYIAGLGRSGSTILDRLLGAQPEFHSAGEVASTWSQGVLEDRLCSCGQPFSSCAFWERVRLTDPTLLTREAAVEAQAYQAKVLRARSMWHLWTRRGRNQIGIKAPPEYFERLSRLYKGISRAADGKIIVELIETPDVCISTQQSRAGRIDTDNPLGARSTRGGVFVDASQGRTWGY